MSDQNVQHLPTLRVRLLDFLLFLLLSNLFICKVLVIVIILKLLTSEIKHTLKG